MCRSDDLFWTEGRAWLRRSYDRLHDWIAAQNEAAFSGGPMPGGDGWTTGRYAKASRASHPFRGAGDPGDAARGVTRLKHCAISGAQ